VKIRRHSGRRARHPILRPPPLLVDNDYSRYEELSVRHREHHHRHRTGQERHRRPHVNAAQLPAAARQTRPARGDSQISGAINAYIRQGEPLGLGHAVLVADLVGDEPFAVILADDVIDAAALGNR
jgi:hypothetical protein